MGRVVSDDAPQALALAVARGPRAGRTLPTIIVCTCRVASAAKKYLLRNFAPFVKLDLGQSNRSVEVGNLSRFGRALRDPSRPLCRFAVRARSPWASFKGSRASCGSMWQDAGRPLPGGDERDEGLAGGRAHAATAEGSATAEARRGWNRHKLNRLVAETAS